MHDFHYYFYYFKHATALPVLRVFQLLDGKQSTI
jgi:hypothetical protein